MDLKEIGLDYVGWICLAQERGQGHTVVKLGNESLFSIKCMDSWLVEKCNFPRKDATALSLLIQTVLFECDDCEIVNNCIWLYVTNSTLCSECIPGLLKLFQFPITHLPNIVV